MLVATPPMANSLKAAIDLRTAAGKSDRRVWVITFAKSES